MTVLQLVFPAAGDTQTINVIPLVSPKEGEWGTVTRPAPLKESAFPNLPPVDQVAPVILPLFPLPDLSTVVVPVPSLKEYAATSPFGCVFTTVAEAVATVLFPPRLALAQKGYANHSLSLVYSKKSCKGVP